MAPLVRRTWSSPGQPPVLPHRTRAHQKVSGIAALGVPPTRDQVHFYFRLHANRNITATEVVAFLRQLQYHLIGASIGLWDRFQAHRANKGQPFLSRASRIHPVFFPPSAPEVNPIAYAWGYLKGNPLATWPRWTSTSWSWAPVTPARPAHTARTSCVPAFATVPFCYASTRTLFIQDSIVRRDGNSRQRQWIYSGCVVAHRLPFISP